MLSLAFNISFASIYSYFAQTADLSKLLTLSTFPFFYNRISGNIIFPLVALYRYDRSLLHQNAIQLRNYWWEKITCITCKIWFMHACQTYHIYKPHRHISLGKNWDFDIFCFPWSNIRFLGFCFLYRRNVYLFVHIWVMFVLNICMA